ncbi:MAG: PHP domain-containing protein [Dehalococcoidia bacterium]|nr:MAG: PHP domain-containing protein [Dehalococcoidia bacterium]
MKIDLHVHTSVLSPDSTLDPEDAIQTARGLGLDGICFTEHDRAWDLAGIDELSAKYNFPVFRGVEVMIKEGGEILVFGLNRNFTTVIDISTLRKMATEAAAFMIAAHPFRGYPCHAITDFDKAAELVLKRPVFDKIDGIEGYNGRNMEGNNIFACQLANRLELPTSGGSDAHARNEMGKSVTIFENTVHNEVEFLNELRSGRFTGSRYRRPE